MKKLLEFQQKVEAIKKDSQNPFFKSNYFDINSLLEEIKPLLNELGLVILQPLSHLGERTSLKTLIIDGETGETILESETLLPENVDPQKMGSSITYFRRYSLQSLLLLQAEDDDANNASNKVITESRPTYQPNYTNKPVYNQSGRKEKVVGEKCPDCGGLFIKGKTGSVYCQNRCWLPENKHLVKKSPAELMGQHYTPPAHNLPEEIPEFSIPPF